MIRYCTVEYRCGGISAVLHFSLPLTCHNIPSMKNLLIVCLCLAASCSALRGFTDAECGVIASQQGHIMRLWTVADPGDSLFLRRKAVPLGREELQSAHFRMLKEGMLATVCDTTDRGVGIAAPQVGVSRRLIAVQRFDKPGEPFCFYVNPEIVWYSRPGFRVPKGAFPSPVSRAVSCVRRGSSSGTWTRSPCAWPPIRSKGSRPSFSSTRSTIWTACCSSTGCCRGSPCPVVARSIPVALVCPLLSPFASGTPRLRSGYSRLFPGTFGCPLPPHTRSSVIPV